MRRCSFPRVLEVLCEGHADVAQRQAPARQVPDGGTYEGEWLNGKKLRER